MDVVKALGELYEEKKRLDSAIAALEARQRQDGGEIESSKRRGRKSMGEEERRAVSQRMAEYWAARKAVQPAELQRPTGPPEQESATA